MKPINKLKVIKCLEQSAKEHAVDIGTSGDISHLSENGETLSQRIKRHAYWNFAIAENIGVMDSTGKEITLSFILDDGNPSRSQRKNIFNEE